MYDALFLTYLREFVEYVESTIGKALVGTGGFLISCGKFLASSPTFNSVGNIGSVYDSAWDWYLSLSDPGQVVVGIVFATTCMLAFVLSMPVLATLALGGDPILSPVPVPSADAVTDDQYAKFYPPEDTDPLLLHADDGEGVIKAYSPSTNEFIGLVPSDSVERVAEKVALARAAQRKWRETTFAERRSVLNVLRMYILEEQHDLCAVAMVDTGKTMLEASLGEILPTLEKLRWVAAEGEQVLQPERRSTGPATVHKLPTLEFHPLGVIGAIAPWNYPMHNLFNPVISSLFAGNAIVVKPSEHTVFSSVYFARIIRRALVLLGHSADLVQVLVGGPEVGAALVEGDIDKLFFTGSTAVGHKVAEVAAKRLLPVVLELGGKDPFIICDDANVAHAADMCLRGTYQNAGQNCIGVERVFVHRDVKEEAVKRFTEAASAIRLGVDMGAITMGDAAVERIQSLVDDAVARGAKVLVGGRRGKGEGDNAEGCFYEATVLDGVRMDMRIAQEEVFGPVLSIFEWTTDAGLVKMVNSSAFGLGSSVFSGDARRADRILASVRSGMGSINDYAVHYLCQGLPFGGTKESGSDRFAGVEGLRGCCLQKSVVRDRIPGIKTTMPKHFKYPIYDNAFALSAEMNDIMYRPGKFGRGDNIRNIIFMLLSKTWKPRSIGSR